MERADLGVSSPLRAGVASTNPQVVCDSSQHNRRLTTFHQLRGTPYLTRGHRKSSSQTARQDARIRHSCAKVASLLDPLDRRWFNEDYKLLIFRNTTEFAAALTIRFEMEFAGGANHRDWRMIPSWDSKAD